MNTTARLPSLALAAVFTVVMLLSIDTLAGAEPGAAQIAQRAATNHS